MIVPLPKIHLTQRAVEWLRTSTTIMGKNYQVAAGIPACLHHIASTEKDSAGNLCWRTNWGRWPTTPTGLWDYPMCAAAHEMDAKIPHPEWCTGVAQVRAIYTQVGRAFLSAPRHPNTPLGNYGQSNFVWQATEILLPNCQHCRMLMAEAWEHVVPKYGQYPTGVSSIGHLIGWKEMARPAPVTHTDESEHQLVELAKMQGGGK